MNALLLACLLLVTFPLKVIALDDDDVQETKKPNSVSEHSSIKINSALQKSSGIQTLKLKANHHQEEFIAQGKVINIQPLLDLRNRYLLVSTDRTNSQAKLTHAEQNLSRHQDLYTNGATSKRNLQEQEALWQSHKAQVTATEFQDKALLNEATVLWGKNLTDWALTKESRQLQPFLNNQEKLIQVTLPSNKHLPETIKTIYVNTAGDRTKAQTAKFVSVATQSDVVAQGESYFFKTSAKNMLSGMNVMVWIPEQTTELNGVSFPKSALIWYLNQAFVYQKTSAETFARRPLLNYSALPDGSYLSDTLNPEDEVVITGAQMLLSEEFKGQIPSEDDD